MGGFVALPVLYVAKWNHIPIFLCEQNSIPGKVNRIFYKHAKCCYLTFTKSLESNAKFTKAFGNPFSSSIQNPQSKEMQGLFTSL